MPNESLVLSNHYFASLPLACFPRIKLHKSNASITSSDNVVAVFWESSVQSAQGTKGEMG